MRGPPSARGAAPGPARLRHGCAAGGRARSPGRGSLARRDRGTL